MQHKSGSGRQRKVEQSEFCSQACLALILSKPKTWNFEWALPRSESNSRPVAWYSDVLTITPLGFFYFIWTSELNYFQQIFLTKSEKYFNKKNTYFFISFGHMHLCDSIKSLQKQIYTEMLTKFRTFSFPKLCFSVNDSLLT